MLERLAAWFLNTYVAEYVGNLNTDQLSIGLLQGAVELEKLPLKRDAFRQLNLPVDIKTGFIGKLKIEIPLTRIQSRAWVVHVDQLYLVAAPSQLTEYNEEEEEARLQEQKQRKLAKLEEQWRAELQKGSWWSVFSLPTAFLANIVHNIQIKITDVHIRYEDEEACPGLPFAVGVTVESISAQTTNDQWDPTFVAESSDQKKLFDCRNLSIYWDTNMAGDVESGPELVDVLKSMVPPVARGSWEELSSAVIAGHRTSVHIVNPVNGQIRLTWNKSPHALRGADGPRLLADVLLDEVLVNLSEHQYHSFLNLVDELQMRRRAVAVARWRPRTAVKEDPASWWRFAFSVVLSRVTEHRRRQTWAFVLARAQLNVRYVQAYTRKLTEPVVDSETSALLSSVEKELTFEELYLLRGITMAKVNRRLATVQTPASGTTELSFLERWLPGWSSGYTLSGASKEGVGLTGQPPGNKGQPSLQKQQSIKEEDEFLQALGFEDKTQTLTRDRTFGKISFTLGQGSLKLTPTPKPDEPFCEPILELKFSSLQTSVELAPKVTETSFALSLGSVEVVDHQNGDSLFPVLLQQRNGPGTSGEPVLALTLKRESVKHTPIWNITATSKPLDVVLNSVLLLQLKDFFVRNDQFGLPLDWTEQVRRRLRELRARTAAELRSQIEELLDVEVKSSRAKLDINLDIIAPQFIIPQSLTDPEASVVILDLGHIRCSNVKPHTVLTSPTVVSEGSMEEQLQEWGEEEDDDEEFMTPPSTPPSEEAESTDGLSHAVDPGLVGKALNSAFDPYDRYHLQCADLQVMVAKAKEMGSESLGTFHSRHHLLHRFTLSLEFKRRLKFTSDPLQANKLVSVHLPLLSLHLDEDKVYGLLVCFGQLLPSAGGREGSGSVADAASRQEDSHRGSAGFTDETLFTSAFQNLPADVSIPLVDGSPKKKALERMESLRHSVRKSKGSTFDSSEYEMVFAQSVLLDVEFTVSRVMLTLCSRGREALELSVAEVRVGMVRRPYDFKGRFVVGDMVVADRLQRFGPQYELMACSSGHRLLLLSPDSTVVERSQQSHSSASSPVEEKRSAEMLRNSIFTHFQPDQSVMLTVEVCQLGAHSPDHPEGGGGEKLRKADIHCQGIDIMANSSTIAEVIAFVKRAMPAEPTSRGGRAQVPHLHPPNLTNIKTAANAGSTMFLDVPTVGSFVFGQLNVRVIRGTAPAPLELSTLPPLAVDHEQCHIVGMVTVSGVHVDVTVDGDVTMTARLCHMEVTDCSVGGTKYPVICRTGKLQGATEGGIVSPLPSLGTRDDRGSESEAVLVTFTQPGTNHKSSPPCNKLTVNVASVHYTHSATFVSEVQGFVSDFQVSLAKMRDSIKDAAVGVAKGLVRQVTNPFGFEMDESLSSPTTGSQTNDMFTCGDSASPSTSRHHLFDIKVATPVVTLPKSSYSEDCVIIHLGQVSLSNKLLPYLRTEDEDGCFHQSQEGLYYEEISVEIANVSMQAVSGFDLSFYVPTRELHCSTQNQRCFKIVNEVSATVTVQRGIDGLKVMQQDKCSHGDQKGEGWDLDGSFGGDLAAREAMEFDFIISGRVEEPISLKMSKEVLEQIKSTLRNIARQSPSMRGMHQADDGASFPTRCPSEDGPLLSSRERASASSSVSLSLSASFVLPKLSLELEHFDDKKFVFVMMQEFAVEASKRQPYETEFNLKLGSIVIEDLLQSEESQYRYIFLTSSKLFPNVPVVSSLGRSAFRGMTKYMATPTFPTHLFVRPAASSSPKKERDSHTESPLRAFSRSATSVDGARRGAGSVSQPHPSLKAESDTFICIKGLLVDENSPRFVTKYDSVTVHLEADFSAASVTINLQTWVILLDFLGIGTPTPPPSRPDSPSPEDLRRRTTSSVTSPSLLAEQQLSSTPLLSSMMIKELMEQDADVFYSLGPKQKTATKSPRLSTSAPYDTGGKMGEIPEDESFPHHEEESGLRSVWGDETKIRMKVLVHIRSLDVTFNKTEYPLVKGTVSGLEVSVNVEKGNVAAEGGLALISVVDLTDKGHYYRDRFATTGQQALQFKVFKYGRPDPNMEREWDMSAEIELGSVRYLHTMRFLKEVLAFCMHFPQLIDAFQRMKELARGTLNYEGPTRKPRISFKVDAEEAYLLIPRHAEDPYLIVGDIGRFTVRNNFRYDGEEGTFKHRHIDRHTDRHTDAMHKQPKRHSSSSSERAKPTRNVSASSHSGPGSASTPSPSNRPRQAMSLFSEVDGSRQIVEQRLASFQGPCLLDCIEVKLMDVDVFTAQRVSFKDGEGHHSYRIIREAGKVLKAKSALDLFIERNLHENLCRNVPDLLVDGVLKATHGMLDKGQLELIKGLVDKNLGEPIEQFETPSSVIKDPVALPLPSERWTTFLFNIELENVQLDFLQSRCCHDNAEGADGDLCLARADIQASNFSFEAFSDQCKKVDFVTHSAFGYDARYEGYKDSVKPNVFVELVKPRLSDTPRRKKSIQGEIHVVITPSKIDASILIHKVRLMGILDLILELKTFIFDSLPEDDCNNPFGEDSDFDEVDGTSELPLQSSDRQQGRSVGRGTLKQATTQLMVPTPEAEPPSPPRVVTVKLSVTETDLVVAEDLTRLDSSAIVMKGTLLLNFKMDACGEKSLYCTVQNLELFSCNLASELSTALSILDPVTVNVEVIPAGVQSSVRPVSESARSKALHDRMVPDAHILKFELPAIQLKFSYRDLKMMVAISRSITRMKETAGGQREEIHSMGGALSGSPSSIVSGNLHAQTVKQPKPTEEQVEQAEEEDSKPFRIGSILLDVVSLSVCVIDDCHFQNVPLARVTAKKLQLEHYLRADPEGAAVAVLATEYFNRPISHWEPLLEEWGFKLNWKKLHKFHTDLDSNQPADMLDVKLTSKHQLLLNVTSSLMQLIRSTHSSWSQDLFGSEDNGNGTEGATPPLTKLQQSGSVKLSEMPRGLALLHSVGHLNQQSKRTPFVPYLLKNNTGLPLKFSKMTSLPNVVVMVGSSPSPGNSMYLNPLRSVSGGTSPSLLVTSLEETSEWQEVPPGGEIPFDFETNRNSIRQRNTSDLVVHQILVQVQGWKRITLPVSVDRVGVVFREVHPEGAPENSLTEITQPQRMARLVFAISLDDAQKVINVRSPLVLNNVTELPLEVRLKAPTVADSNSKSTARKGTESVELDAVPPGGHLSIPLHLTDWEIRVRPKHWGVRFCNEPIEWSPVTDPAHNAGSTKSCDAIGDGDPFLLCVSVVREGYPVDTPPLIQPGHTLTFYPPLSVVNLLPYDVHFLLSGKERSKIIRRGERLSHYDVNWVGRPWLNLKQTVLVTPTNSIEFSIFLEDFPHSQMGKVSHSTVGMLQKLTVYDPKERALDLTVECLSKGGMALEVLISCPFWLINDTGLPLVFKQDHSPHEFANQFSEHEKANNRQPLLFSYSDVDQSDLCTARLGRETHSSGSPRWCTSFTMVRGMSFIRLFWRCDDGRPEREYQIGMDIRQCHGNMRHSRIVTFVPRYKLDNRTSHEIVFAQRYQIFDEANLERQGLIMTAKPGATVTFHWPRFDLDQLLCVRIKDIHDCQWSGGFPLVNDGSLCVNMRGAMGRCLFLRVEIVNKGATSFVIFSEAANFPLPFRLENFSQVSVQCSQTNVNYGCLLNPGQIVPYAWDEPVGECSFSIQVCGVEENSEVFKPSSFATLGHLYYKNYIYIAAAATFEHLPGATTSVEGVVGFSDTSVRRHVSEHQEVVLDVPQGTAVVFRKKTPGATTQLWRMAAEGQLIHIASSESSGQDMVLDVAYNLPRRPGEYTPLVLSRRTQSSRLAYQTWRFTGDYLVLKETQNLCVQSRKGFESFREGADAVLGVWSKDPSLLELQRMKPLKHRPGSGVLAVRLISDGPTHVLRIADSYDKFSHLAPREMWLPGGRQDAPPNLASLSSVVSTAEAQDEEDMTASNLDIEVSMSLEEGVGISLINSLPEELLFASLKGLRAGASLVSSSHKFSLSVHEIQVDSKLYSTNFPVLLYPTPSEEEVEEGEVPAAEVTVEHVRHHLPGTVVFKSVSVRVCEVTVMLEERLLFSLVQWAGEGLASTDKTASSEGKEAFEMLTRRSAAPVLGSDSLVHFDAVNVSKVVVRLSMHTNSSLPPDLKQIKQSLVIPIVKFEAPLVLAKYHQRHLSGARQIVLDSVISHYKKAIKRQSLKIVGSVDLLGNPTGLVSDIASGVSGMISHSPDVVGLLRDITHGITDSTSKLAGSASDILGRATFDSSYQDEREQISDTCQTSSDHLTAGLIGLSSGVFGGLTSIFTQPYYSAKNDGIGGLFTGIGKGVMGTFTKPVVGVLDFASSATAAIRETTSRVSRVRPDPVRLKRNCVGPSGALTPYQPKMARAQTYLRLLTDGKMDERLVAYEYLTTDGPRVLISTNFVYLIKQTPPTASDVEAKIPLEILHHCRDTTSRGDGGENAPLVVLLVEDLSDAALPRSHKFRCSSEVVARKVAQLINFAKTVHEYEKTVVQSYHLQMKGIW